MRIGIISDTHAKYNSLKIPAVDLLIVAGDFTHHSRDPEDLEIFAKWIDNQSQISEAVICCGNSEMMSRKMSKMEIRSKLEVSDKIHYLQDESKIITKSNLKFYASPWTSSRNMGFSASHEKLAEKFGLIPDDTDILITHMPPFGILDQGIKKKNIGDFSLRNKIDRLQNLKMHVFGHVHEYGGQGYFHKTETSKICCINGAMLKLHRKSLREPIIIDFNPETNEIKPVFNIQFREDPFNVMSVYINTSMDWMKNKLFNK